MNEGEWRMSGDECTTNVKSLAEYVIIIKEVILLVNIRLQLWTAWTKIVKSKDNEDLFASPPFIGCRVSETNYTTACFGTVNT